MNVYAIVPVVVNCLQISIFALSQTTAIITAAQTLGLWIAYKLVSLHYRKQQIVLHVFC